MADENRPFIGYRSAGRRPESQQDRRAAADAPLSALRGMVSGVLGAPGDIESLIRMLPGLSERTVLPTSEDVERRLPMRELNQTPTGRAFTTAGQLGGGFYTGPGSPLRAIAALPSAVSRAAGDFAMAAGQPAVNVVKPKGGNWLAGSVERVVEPMKTRVIGQDPAARLRDLDAAYAQNVEAGVAIDPDVFARERVRLESDAAMNRWLESKLGKYIKNEMATPEDPLRALAERGVMHAEIGPTGYSLKGPRAMAGFPEEGVGVSPMAKTWEDRADTFINQLHASDLTRGYPEAVDANPWLAKVPPQTRVYEMLRGAEEDLGFTHLADELRNAINPASGLPENLRWKYQDLDKVTVPQAVERVAKINEWRAAQKAEADMARAMGPATQVVKEYPEQGYKWVELRQPEVKEMPEGYSVKPMDKDGWFAVYGPDGRSTGAVGKSPDEAVANQEFGRQSLEDALKYEGETMGHCVGGYCPDVVEGRSKIYSLRDKKGQPHVTIEVAPRPIKNWRDVTAAVGPDESGKLYDEFDKIGGFNMDDTDAAFEMFIKNKGIKALDDIVQIKGKANRAPNAEYLPAVQDFVRSGQWGRVGDLGNAGLVEFTERAQHIPKGLTGVIPKFKESGITPGYYREDELADLIRSWQSGGETGLTSGARGEGFAEGGQVSGANFPTDDFDPARIDAIVDELHAMNAG